MFYVTWIAPALIRALAGAVLAAFRSGCRATLGVYRVLNTRAAAAEFWYADRLQSEIAEYRDGRADIHEHPLEPIMGRLTISKMFGAGD